MVVALHRACGCIVKLAYAPTPERVDALHRRWKRKYEVQVWPTGKVLALDLQDLGCKRGVKEMTA